MFLKLDPSNHPRLERGHFYKVPITGSLNITNVGLSEARAVSKDHDAVITVLDYSDHMLKFDDLLTSLTPNTGKLMLFDKVPDRSDLYRDRHVGFFRMMQSLHGVVPDIANGEYGQDVMVNCLAGISRSSAVTLWIMAHAMPDESAKNLVDMLTERVNQKALPNEAIIGWVAENDDRVPSLKELPGLIPRSNLMR